MLDSDLATLYEVPTKRLLESVKRNKDRFPEDFMFQLALGEWQNLRSQIATSSLDKHGGRRTPPYVFTQEGVAMLSGVLRSAVAIEINITIMRAFTKMREALLVDDAIKSRLEQIDRTLEIHDSEIQTAYKVLKKLMDCPTVPKKRQIGFVVEV
jgi:phage regulator Rha-like protein